MRIKFPHIFPIVVTLAATVSVGFAAELDLWFTPLSTEGPMKAPLTKWMKESLPKELPGVTVGYNYGPPVYQDGQQKFIVQGRKGKPDVIESVLEGMIAYQRAGLLDTGVNERLSGVKWCCVGFESAVGAAGERGFGIFVDDTTEPPLFVIQHRALDPGAPLPQTDTPLNIVCQTGLKHCPWCGKKLAKWYKGDLSKLSRADLVIPLR